MTSTSEVLKADHALIARAQVGNDKARAQVVAKYTRYIYGMANKHAHHGNVEDLAQQGMVGLLRAIEKFDPKHNVVFLTYAAFWIYQEVTKSTAHEAKHEHETLRHVSNEAIDTEATSAHEAIDFSSESTKNHIVKALMKITHEQREIIRRRYMNDTQETHATIAKSMGFSRAWVQKLDELGCSQMRKYLTARGVTL